MSISRVPFASRFTGPETLVVCVLIAGVPVVLVPAGVVVDATVASDGSVDPLWWPGEGPLEVTLPDASTVELPRAWLDPEAVTEVFRATDPVKGDAKVEALVFEMFDPGGAATALVSASMQRPSSLLAVDVTDASTSVQIASAASVPSSGVAWIGREALTYSGVTGATLTGCARGVFGTRARARHADPNGPPVVTFGEGPRYWYGRLTSVWVCRLDGTTLYDPTCIYVGTIGPGVQRTRKGARWSIPIDNVVEVLQRKIARTSITITGICHLNTLYSPRSPLAATTDLGHQSGSPDRDGWHPDWRSFMADWDATARARVPAGQGTFTGSHIQVIANLLGAGIHYTIYAAWNTPPIIDVFDENADGQITWTSQSEAPDTVAFLDGYVPLPMPGDAAKIPSTLTHTVGDATARYTLSVEKVANGEECTALVLGTGTQGSLDYVRVTALVNTGRNGAARRAATLITERSTALLGVQSEGTALDALRAAAAAIDELDGGLHEDGTIDWDQIASAFGAVPLGALPSQRAYQLGDGDAILSMLTQELRLRGMAMATRWGRLAAFRTAVFASTEEIVATIVEEDILCDGGKPIEPEVIDSPLPVATSATFKLPGGSSFQWIDASSRGELGDGADIACTALEHLPVTVDVTQLPTAIQQTAQQLLGVVAVPFRTIRVTLGPTFLGLQEGDLVSFSHPRVPTLEGTIGVDGAVCQVQETRTQVGGGKGRMIALLRPQESDLAGYAPEALVAAGGLAVADGHTTVTIDTSSAWGATCFARERRPDGTASTSAVDGFAAGQYVRLAQIGTRAPISDEGFTVVSVDAATNTVVLSGEATIDMQTAAAGAYGCLLRFAAWPTIDAGSAPVRADQERYLFIADAASGVLGSNDPAKRWAA